RGSRPIGLVQDTALQGPDAAPRRRSTADDTDRFGRIPGLAPARRAARRSTGPKPASWMRRPAMVVAPARRRPAWPRYLLGAALLVLVAAGAATVTLAVRGASDAEDTAG